MRRKRKNNIAKKSGLLFIILILSLATISVSYAHWDDNLVIHADMETTSWNNCIRIKKSIEGAGCCDQFILTITVENNGTTDLENVVVTDTIGEKATVISWSEPQDTTVTWSGKDLTWTIGDLASGDVIELIIIIEGICNPEDYIPAVVTYPEDTKEQCTHQITRYTPSTGVTETVYYVVVIDEVNTVKFEDCENSEGEEYNLGEDSLVQTDTFIMRAIGGSVKVTTTTKTGSEQSGGKEAISILIGEGSSVLDDNGFEIKIVRITNISSDEKEYEITITSGANPKGLSHVEFDFGKYCRLEINDGATVTAEPWAVFSEDPLEATTEGITLVIDEDGVLMTTLPYSTPWAWYCMSACCCNEE